MNRKFEIIETPDYILAVSDEDVGINIPFWGYCWNWYKKVNFFKNGLNENARGRGGIQKIIAYQPKNNYPELNLPLLPEIVVKDDVKKLAENYALNCTQDWYYPAKNGFIAGYKAATKLYDEDDLSKAMHFGKFGEYEGIKTTQKFIQSLKQPKTPKWFVAEMEDCECNLLSYPDQYELCKDKVCDKIKTTTINSKTYLVGNYKFG